MFDPRLISPDSPVDSAMFPPVYNRSTSSSSTASMSSCPDLQQPTSAGMPVKPAPVAGVFSFKHEPTSSFRGELEPFEFRPNPSSNPTPRTQAGTSLSSVFGDQDLIDAIMCSLTTEQATGTAGSAGHVGNRNITIPVLSPVAFSMPRRIQHIQVPQPTSFTALMQQRPHSIPLIGATGRPAMTGPCLRKPGTFLNKDGRWIKGKPCRMEGCDKRAQSNGLSANAAVFTELLATLGL
ncbi:hypothetical protein PF005_g19391 [Phytophthora fragariae]|uniref:Uncharacterized protein n=1 Tax=Phytophthora fragariae TaxID=53985 RepID=A0A6A3WSL6_9STRA|nr:hypothetical protein PF005_g19391 [Phytophthora fragariae]